MKVNKTFSIDLELIGELKKLRNRNGGLRNNSAFVNDAIWMKMNSDRNASDFLNEASTIQLIRYLKNRPEIDSTMNALLENLQKEIFAEFSNEN